MLSAIAVAILLQACGGGQDAPESTERANAAGGIGETGTGSADRKVATEVRAAAAAVGAETWYQIPASADPLFDGVTPTASAHQTGMWSANPIAWPINAIHMIVLPNGKLLTYGTRPYDNNPDTGNQDGSSNVLWDPAAGTGPGAFTITQFATNPKTELNSFCSSAALMSNGKVLTAGGTGGPYIESNLTTSSFMSGIYSPDTNFTERGSNTSDERWYSTMLTLPDSRQILLGGMVPYAEASWTNPSTTNGLASMTPEIYTPGQGWSYLSGAYSTEAFGQYLTRSEFPHAWVTPSGEVFGISSDRMWFLDPNANGGRGAIRSAGEFKGQARGLRGGETAKDLPNVGSGTSSAVMYAPGKALQMGGNGYWVVHDLPASAAATIVDFSSGTAKLTETGPMNYGRRFFNSTLLPNGQVFVNGGTKYGNDLGNAVLAGEIWNPATGAWTVMASQKNARLYHNTAGLLPNGIVMSAGGGNPAPVFNRNAELFYPPYLFRQVNGVTTWATRPVISGTTAFKVAHGGAFSLDLSGSKIKELALMGLGVTTHNFNAGQRRVPLSFTQTQGRVDVTVPDANLAPPGYYMVVAIDDQGVPSKGVVMAVGAGVEPPPVRMEPMPGVTLSNQMPTPAVAAGQYASYAAQLSVTDAQVSWNFGDGTAPTAFGANVAMQHAYASPGLYTVVLSMKNRNGLISTYTFIQAVNGTIAAQPGRASGSMALERRTTGGDRLWVVNPDHQTVAAVSTLDGGRTEIKVGEEPRAVSIAYDGTVGVVNKRAATVSLINPKTLTILRTVALPRGSLPHGLVFSPNGSIGYVALEGTGQIARFTTATGALLPSFTVGGIPRHLSLRGDGGYLAVSRYITPALPGEDTASVNASTAGGEVVIMNPTTGAITKTVTLQHSNAPDTAISGRGIPNYLGPMVFSPDNAMGWVPSKQDNVLRGQLRDGQPLDFQSTVRAVSSRIRLDTLAELPASRVDHDNAGVASAAAFSPYGQFAFVTLETSREVAVLNAAEGLQLLRVDVGHAPQAVIPSRDGRTLYVQNFMGRSVTVIDLAPLVDYGQRVATVKATWKTTAVTESSVEAGKRLFYDARDTRLARDGYMSCASCHNDGGTDGRTWDMTHQGEGLRNTPTLRGRMGTDFGRLHWTGNFDEVQDFEQQIRGLAGGTGLMADVQYFAGTVSTPLGDRKAGKSTDLDALAAYVNSLNKPDPSPYRSATGTLSAAAQAGQTLFTTKNCVSCHAAPSYTNSKGNGLFDVGTLKPSSGKRLDGPLTGLDTPSLRGAWSSAPYLHDGSAKTVEAAISAHTKTGQSLTASELANLAAFVKEVE